MTENKDLESKLKNCADELDSCATLIRDHEIEPVKENISKIGHIIADISDLLVMFESYREKLKKPWKNRCSFCKKDEDQVNKLIAGPMVLICNECADICVGMINSDSQENTFNDK